MLGPDAPLLNHVAEHPHHALGLLLGEPLLFQPLHKLERVEMVVLGLLRRCAEAALKLQGRPVPTCAL